MAKIDQNKNLSASNIVKISLTKIPTYVSTQETIAISPKKKKKKDRLPGSSRKAIIFWLPEPKLVGHEVGDFFSFGCLASIANFGPGKQLFFGCHSQNWGYKVGDCLLAIRLP